jgi:uncharacterized protein DUF2877
MNAPVIRVLRAGADVAERLRAAPHDAGRVHSVFERALNLDWHDGRLLMLQGPGPLLAPFAAALERLPRSPALHSGQEVWRRGDTLTLDDISLELRGLATVDTIMPEAGTGPCPGLSALSAPSSAANGLSSAIGRRARSRLAEGVRARDPVAFIEGALGLIGLGEGLTPAGDDCLVGALAVLHRFARSWLCARPEISATVGRAGAVATTTVAHEFVAHALAGRFADSLIDLLTAESADEVGRAAAQLLRSGATSGADTLCGVHLAVAALTGHHGTPA